MKMLISGILADMGMMIKSAEARRMAGIHACRYKGGHVESGTDAFHSLTNIIIAKLGYTFMLGYYLKVW